MPKPYNTRERRNKRRKIALQNLDTQLSKAKKPQQIKRISYEIEILKQRIY